MVGYDVLQLAADGLDAEQRLEGGHRSPPMVEPEDELIEVDVRLVDGHALHTPGQGRPGQGRGPAIAVLTLASTGSSVRFAIEWASRRRPAVVHLEFARPRVLGPGQNLDLNPDLIVSRYEIQSNRDGTEYGSGGSKASASVQRSLLACRRPQRAAHRCWPGTPPAGRRR
jgi:hypothetical protein